MLATSSTGSAPYLDSLRPQRRVPNGAHGRLAVAWQDPAQGIAAYSRNLLVGCCVDIGGFPSLPDTSGVVVQEPESRIAARLAYWHRMPGECLAAGAHRLFPLPVPGAGNFARLRDTCYFTAAIPPVQNHHARKRNPGRRSAVLHARWKQDEVNMEQVTLALSRNAEEERRLARTLRKRWRLSWAAASCAGARRTSALRPAGSAQKQRRSDRRS